jgi:hypothetical protein
MPLLRLLSECQPSICMDQRSERSVIHCHSHWSASCKQGLQCPLLSQCPFQSVRLLLCDRAGGETRTENLNLPVELRYSCNLPPSLNTNSQLIVNILKMMLCSRLNRSSHWQVTSNWPHNRNKLALQLSKHRGTPRRWTNNECATFIQASARLEGTRN